MTDLQAAAEATAGPFFEAHWRINRVWHSQKYRLFRHAKERCIDETKWGAELAYVRHILTDEAVYSCQGTSRPSSENEPDA